MALIRIVGVGLFCVLLAHASYAQPAPSVRVIVPEAEVRERANGRSAVKGTALAGTVFEVLDKAGDWYWVVLPADIHGSRNAGWITAQSVEIVAGTFALTVFPVTLAGGQRQAVPTVHVSTQIDPSGLQDSAAMERQKAVTAITKRLSSQKNIRVVGNPAEATITIAVTSVSKEPVWQPTSIAAATPLKPGEPLPEGTRPVMVARAVLTRGTFTTSFAEAAGAFRASANENLARSIESWFRANAQALAALP